MKKGIYLFLILFLSMTSLVMAQDEVIAVEDNVGSAYFLTDGLTINVLHPMEIALNEDFYIYASFYDKAGKLQEKDDAECIFGLLSPTLDRVIIYNESDMIFLNSDTIQATLVNGSFFNETGTYFYNYNCDETLPINIGGYSKGEIKVTLSGTNQGLETLLVTVALIVIFSLLIFIVYSYKNKANFDRMYKRLLTKYEEKNYVKFVTNSLWYNVLKNSWVIYYTIGFVIMMLVFDLTYLFNIESMFNLMKMFMSMYAWGFIVVGMLFLSYLQEFIVNMKEELLNNNWGISNE